MHLFPAFLLDGRRFLDLRVSRARSENGLFAQRFDERRLELDGDAVQGADHLDSYLDGSFSLRRRESSSTEPLTPDSQLTLFNRRSHENRPLGRPDRYTALAVSPDDARVLVSEHVPHSTVDQDPYMFALSGEAGPLRMTFAQTLESRAPVGHE